MLHLFFEYLSLCLAEAIALAEKVLPEFEISEVHAMSLYGPVNWSLYNKAAWACKHMPVSWHVWVLEHVAPGYLDNFRDAVYEGFLTNLQMEEWDRQWESANC